MNISIQKNKYNLPMRLLTIFMVISFLTNLIAFSSPAYAQMVLNLPTPGSKVHLSPGFMPAVIRGVKINPQDPFTFDFLIDSGHSQLEGEFLQKESTKLIKYFLASLTVPEDELWVNLSPYEKDRIIPEKFGETEMGRDLLAQDYILKQLTASLIYPEDELGKKFWDRVHEKARDKLSETEIPVDIFHKVWIVPERAVLYEDEGTAIITESHLKVMLEQDYLAMQKNENLTTDSVASDVLREVILPEIEREVNTGKNFAQLRQIYHSLILAAWYKRKLKETILSQVYVNQNKVVGVDVDDKDIKLKIYDHYLEAFKKGVYNYIKEDYDPVAQEVIPRKYFSGGTHFGEEAMDAAIEVRPLRSRFMNFIFASLVGAVLLVTASCISPQMEKTEVERQAELTQEFKEDVQTVIEEMKKGIYAGVDVEHYFYYRFSSVGVAYLLELVKEQDESTQIIAYKLLAGFGKSFADSDDQNDDLAIKDHIFPTLREGLKNKSPKVRHQALMGLAKLYWSHTYTDEEDRKNVEAIFGFIKAEKDKDVFPASIAALGKMLNVLTNLNYIDARIFPLLKNYITHKDHNVKASVLFVYGQIGGYWGKDPNLAARVKNEIIPKIENFLTHPQEEIKIAARGALGHITTSAEEVDLQERNRLRDVVIEAFRGKKLLFSDRMVLNGLYNEALSTYPENHSRRRFLTNFTFRRYEEAVEGVHSYHDLEAIYNNTIFQTQTKNLNSASQFSTAVSLNGTALRFGRSLESLSDKQYSDLLSFIIRIRESFAQGDFLNKDTNLVIVANDHKDSIFPDMVEAFAQSLGIKKITKLVGKKDKQSAIDIVKNSPPGTVFWFTGHGGKKHFWMFNGVIGREASEDLSHPNAISFEELREAIQERAKRNGDLSDDIFIFDACFSSDFRTAVLNTIAEDLEKIPIQGFPRIVASSFSGTKAKSPMFLSSLLSHLSGKSREYISQKIAKKGHDLNDKDIQYILTEATKDRKDLFGSDLFESEEIASNLQDFSFVFPTTANQFDELQTILEVDGTQMIPHILSGGLEGGYQRIYASTRLPLVEHAMTVKEKRETLPQEEWGQTQVGQDLFREASGFKRKMGGIVPFVIAGMLSLIFMTASCVTPPAPPQLIDDAVQIFEIREETLETLRLGQSVEMSLMSLLGKYAFGMFMSSLKEEDSSLHEDIFRILLQVGATQEEHEIHDAFFVVNAELLAKAALETSSFDLQKALNAIREGLNDQDWKVRQFSLKVLSYIWSPLKNKNIDPDVFYNDMIPLLRSGLNDPHESVRMVSLKQMSLLLPRIIFQGTFRGIKSRDEDKAEQAFLKTTVDAVNDLLVRETEPKVIAAGLPVYGEALDYWFADDSKMKEPYLARIIRYLKGDELIVLQALKALADFGWLRESTYVQDQIIPAIKQVARERDSGIRMKCIESLGRIGRKQAYADVTAIEKDIVPFIVEALKDEYEIVRGAARSALSDVYVRNDAIPDHLRDSLENILMDRMEKEKDVTESDIQFLKTAYDYENLSDQDIIRRLLTNLDRAVSDHKKAKISFRDMISIYGDEYFTEMTKDSSDLDQFSLARAVTYNLESEGKSVNETTIKIALDQVLSVKKQHLEHVYFDKDTEVVILSHDADYMFYPDVLKSILNAIGVTNVRIFIGEEEIDDGLAAVENLGENSVVWVTAHGFYNGFEISEDGYLIYTDRFAQTLDRSSTDFVLLDICDAARNSNSTSNYMEEMVSSPGFFQSILSAIGLREKPTLDLPTMMAASYVGHSAKSGDMPASFISSLLNEPDRYDEIHQLIRAGNPKRDQLDAVIAQLAQKNITQITGEDLENIRRIELEKGGQHIYVSVPISEREHQQYLQNLGVSEDFRDENPDAEEGTDYHDTNVPTVIVMEYNPEKTIEPRGPRWSDYPHPDTYHPDEFLEGNQLLANNERSQGPTKNLRLTAINDHIPTETFDSAMDAQIFENRNEVGGIDLNPANIGWETNSTGKPVLLPLDSQQIQQINIEGLTPVILNIVPIDSLPLFLGVGEVPPRDPNDLGYHSNKESLSRTDG